MMRKANVLARAAAIIACTMALLLGMALRPMADGESSSEVYNSGMLIPIDDTSVEVLGQRIDVIMPKPPQENQAYPPATIRVQYELIHEENSPVTIKVAWPSGGLDEGMQNHEPEYPISISLDGKQIPYRFLREEDLAGPYIVEWLKQIDQLLTAKPKLKAKVLELRKIVPKPTGQNQNPTVYNANCRELADQFGKWMIANSYIKSAYRDDASNIAAGLMGMNIGSNGWSVQFALRWLDPNHRELDIHRELSDRWGYASLLLDPNTHWLTRVDGLFSSAFAVIRFDIKLTPKIKHVLSVSYKQSLGFVGRPPDFYGLAYFMEPARRWHQWDRTTINITAPKEWAKVVVRPTPSSSLVTAQAKVMTIEMPGRPYENLYISVVPPPESKEKRQAPN